MTARTTIAALALAAGACQTEPPAHTASRPAPLIGGAVHTGDEAAVAITTPGGFPFCTGTLVSPAVVVTAAHCIDMAAGDPEITVFFGDDTEGDGRKVGVKLSKTHPQWTGSLSDRHDIGLMLLNFPQDPLLPIPLNTSPVSDHIGDEVRRIGFGIYDRDTGDADGKKREGSTVIHTVPSGTDYFYAGDDQLSTCNGDSGGPALLTVGAVEYIAGVHSFGFDSGDTRCVPPNNGDTRVDLYADTFLVPWIDEFDPACGADGLCAPIGCSDDPDCEPCGADGTCTDDCPLPDPDCPTSGVGEICQANSQCTTGLCTFWQNDPGTRFCTEPCSGDGDCPADMSCQNRPNIGDVCYYDSDPDGVLGDDCQQATDCGSYICEMGQCVTECDLTRGLGCAEGFDCSTLDDGANYYCHAVDSGGGGCDAGGGNAGLLLLLLTAGSLGLGRRRAMPGAPARRSR